MSPHRQLLLIMKTSEKLKIFLMLGIIKAKSNIKLNELAEIKSGNGMILLNLIISQKLLRISISIIPINRNLEQKR